MVSFPEVSINTDMSASRCFGCGQNNPIGLKLRFESDGRTTRAEFIPGKQYQGWEDVLHGGITACILDEAMAHAARFAGRTCVTAKMDIRFSKPAPLDQPLVITSHVTRNTSRLVEAVARIALRDGTVIAEGSSVQYVVEENRKGTAKPVRDA